MGNSSTKPKSQDAAASAVVSPQAAFNAAYGNLPKRQGMIQIDSCSHTITVSWPDVPGAERYVLQYRMAGIGASDKDFITLSDSLSLPCARKRNLIDQDNLGFYFRAGAVFGGGGGQPGGGRATAAGGRAYTNNHDNHHHVHRGEYGEYDIDVSVSGGMVGGVEGDQAIAYWVTHAQPFRLLPHLDQTRRMEAPRVFLGGKYETLLVTWKQLVVVLNGVPSPSDTIRYELQVREDRGAAPWTTIAESLVGTHVRKKNLAYDTAYQFRVRPIFLVPSSSSTRVDFAFSPPSTPPAVSLGLTDGVREFFYPLRQPATLLLPGGDPAATWKETTSLRDGLGGKEFVLIYASARWCGASHEYVTKLRRFYDSLYGAPNYRLVEIVYLSADHESMAYALHYKTMPWLAVDYADQPGREQLLRNLGLEDETLLPRLIVLDGRTGRLIEPNALRRSYSLERWRELAADPNSGQEPYEDHSAPPYDPPNDDDDHYYNNNNDGYNDNGDRNVKDNAYAQSYDDNNNYDDDDQGRYDYPDNDNYNEYDHLNNNKNDNEDEGTYENQNVGYNKDQGDDDGRYNVYDHLNNNKDDQGDYNNDADVPPPTTDTSTPFSEALGATPGELANEPPPDLGDDDIVENDPYGNSSGGPSGRDGDGGVARIIANPFAKALGPTPGAMANVPPPDLGDEDGGGGADSNNNDPSANSGGQSGRDVGGGGGDGPRIIANPFSKALGPTPGAMANVPPPDMGDDDNDNNNDDPNDDGGGGGQYQGGGGGEDDLPPYLQPVDDEEEEVEDDYNVYDHLNNKNNNNPDDDYEEEVVEDEEYEEEVVEDEEGQKDEPERHTFGQVYDSELTDID